MTTSDDIMDGLRCIFCSQTHFRVAAPIPATGTAFDTVTCAGCGETYDVIDGTPFLCEFRGTEFPLLAVTFTEMPLPRGIPPEAARVLLGLLGGYHASTDKPDFLREHLAAFTGILPDVTAEAISDQIYPEWAHWDAMLGGARLDGLSVLIVDAGTGVDAVRFLDRGAAVTCMERWPARLTAGRDLMADVRWIGGAAHSLPFPDASFDLVYVNGTVCHGSRYRDVVGESVRVLRPEGRLLLTGVETRDGRVDDAPDRRVLTGDGVPRSSFADLYQPLDALGVAISLNIIADPGEGERIAEMVPIGQGDLRDGWVPVRDGTVDALSQSCVRASFLATRIGPLSRKPAVQSPRGIRPSWLDSWLRDAEAGLARLLAWAPPGAIASGAEASPPPAQICRTRARWLHRVQAGDETPRLRVRSLGTPFACVLRANAVVVAEQEIGPEWIEISSTAPDGNDGDVVLWDLAATPGDKDPDGAPIFELALLGPGECEPGS